MGNYNRKKVSTVIPAQRTYELAFTCLVTDTQIWDELRSDTEKRGASNNEEIQLLFRKETGEEIKLVLRDYYVSSATVPIPDDKGPIEVEMSIMARNMETATSSTTWITQGWLIMPIYDNQRRFKEEQARKKAVKDTPTPPKKKKKVTKTAPPKEENTTKEPKSEE